MIGTKELTEILPQAYPFLFIDRITEFEKDKKLIAIKNITANEWNTIGHNGSAHFPETLMIEAASQAALALHQLSKIKPGEKRPLYILGKVTAEFLQSVAIGDQLVIEARAKMLEAGGYSDVTISVGDLKVAQVEIIYSVKK